MTDGHNLAATNQRDHTSPSQGQETNQQRKRTGPKDFQTTHRVAKMRGVSKPNERIFTTQRGNPQRPGDINFRVVRMRGVSKSDEEHPQTRN
jgi:hypothetical protein